MYGIKLFMSKKKTVWHEIFAYVTFRKLRTIFFLGISSLREGMAIGQDGKISIEQLKNFRTELFPEVSDYTKEFIERARRVFESSTWEEPIAVAKKERKLDLRRLPIAIKPIGEILTFEVNKKKKI